MYPKYPTLHWCTSSTLVKEPLILLGLSTTMYLSNACTQLSHKPCTQLSLYTSVILPTEQAYWLNPEMDWPE